MKKATILTVEYPIYQGPLLYQEPCYSMQDVALLKLFYKWWNIKTKTDITVFRKDYKIFSINGNGDLNLNRGGKVIQGFTNPTKGYSCGNFSSSGYCELQQKKVADIIRYLIIHKDETVSDYKGVIDFTF